LRDSSSGVHHRDTEGTETDIFTAEGAEVARGIQENRRKGGNECLLKFQVTDSDSSLAFLRVLRVSVVKFIQAWEKS
jgi:hypothetical protein